MPLGPEWVKGGGVLGDRVQPVYPRLRKDRHLPKLSRRCQFRTSAVSQTFFPGAKFGSVATLAGSRRDHTGRQLAPAIATTLLSIPDIKRQLKNADRSARNGRCACPPKQRDI